MTFLRSLIFQIAFYGTTTAFLIAYLPWIFTSESVVRSGLRRWAKTCLYLLERINGISVVVRDSHHTSATPCLYAAKHQSTLETIALFLLFDDPAIVLKVELTNIPVLGAVFKKARLIPIDRSGSRAALRAMTDAAKDAIDHGQPVVIFPEGTRRAVGAAPDYKKGVALLYAALKQSCLPVALNTGLFWKRKQLRRSPGTAIIQFLPHIPPGLKGADFTGRLVSSIEAAAGALAQDNPARPPDRAPAAHPVAGLHARTTEPVASSKP